MLKFLLLVASMPTLGAASAAMRFRARAARRQQVYARGRQQARFRGTLTVRGSQTGPVEQLEDWKDHGKALKTRVSDDVFSELASGITTEAYSRELHDFVDHVPSRFVAHPGNANTATYIKEQFKNMGLKVSEQTVDDERIKMQYVTLLENDPEYKTNKGDNTNVIGFWKGGDLANEVVLLGAHYDSVNWEDTGASAPGVDDNGSGSALMLSVARALTAAGEKFRPRRSIMFVAFNAEEEGLVGSEHFVKMYRTTGKDEFGDLKAAFIADEVAWPGRGKDEREVIFETSGQGPEVLTMVDTLAKLAMFKNKTSSVPGDGLGDGTHNFVVNYHGFGSDHMSFLNEDLPAVLLIERDDDFHAEKWGHSDRDTFEHVDLHYGASMTRLALRAIAAFANPEE